MSLSIKPLDAPFGGLVQGWNPGIGLTADELSQLQEALNKHLLLLFRGHRVPSNEELVSFACSFGELAKVADIFDAVVRTYHPLILPVVNDPERDTQSDSGILPWHADYSYLARPAKESFLEACEIPDRGGATSFCNLYSAWDSLPQRKRDRLTTLNARHSIEGYKDSKVGADLDAGESIKPDDGSLQVEINIEFGGKVWHPVAFQHPQFGKTALYMDSMVCEIEGIPNDEAIGLRDELIAGATAADNVYRHEWHRGDLVVFDAFGSLHHRESFDPRQRRTMRQLSTLVPLT